MSDKLKSDSEERIISAVTALFYKHGIRSITMDEVARHLSISKKTLYRHFADKNDMVLKCCASDMQKQRESLSSIALNASDPVEELIMLMRYLEVIFSSVNPNLFHDMMRYHPEAWQLYCTFKEEQMRHRVETNLIKGIEAGLYRKDINVKVLARLRMEQVEMGFNAEIYPPLTFSLREVQMNLFDHFMHGITTLKGHKLINRYKQINEED